MKFSEILILAIINWEVISLWFISNLIDINLNSDNAYLLDLQMIAKVLITKSCVRTIFRIRLHEIGHLIKEKGNNIIDS